MAKRRAPRRPKPVRSKRGRKTSPTRQSVKRKTTKTTKKTKAAAKRRTRRVAKRATKGRRVSAARKASRGRGRTKPSRIQRERRTLNELTPPSSLDLERQPSAAMTGRHELQRDLLEHTGMTPAITGGDVDADWENAYFSGDEAPGGDNPTPDQDRVDDIGRSIGLQYEDAEELKGDEKVEERDKHRWELDPASSEDYPDRK